MRKETTHYIKNKLQHTITISGFDKNIVNEIENFVKKLIAPKTKTPIIFHQEIKTSSSNIIMFKTTISSPNPRTKNFK